MSSSPHCMQRGVQYKPSLWILDNTISTWEPWHHRLWKCNLSSCKLQKDREHGIAGHKEGLSSIGRFNKKGKFRGKYSWEEMTQESIPEYRIIGTMFLNY